MKRLLFFSILIICLPLSAFTQSDLQKGWSQFYKGEYSASLESFKQAGSRSSARIEAIVGQSLALQELGRYDEAHKLLSSEPDAWLLHRLGKLSLLSGDLKAAGQQFQKALQLQPAFLPAQLDNAIVQWQLGERAEARKTLYSFLDFYRKSTYLSADEIALVARACVYLERFQDANRLYSDAVKKQPENWQLYIPWGDLFLEKYNEGDALSVYNDALKKNPNCQPALLGVARAAASSEPGTAIETAKRALELNPASPAAQTTLTEFLLVTGKEKEAAKHLDNVLEEYPHYVPALALKASLADRAQDDESLQKIIADVASYNPKEPGIFVRLAEDNARRYLFRESIEYYRRALALDSEHRAAEAGLGISLSRLAKEKEAKQHLEKAFRHDPFNILTGNLLNLFDDFVEYDTVRTEHFLIKMHRDDKPVIGHVAAALCEQAYANMIPRYGADLPTPVTVEIFPEHDDFAVRCFGLPGAQVFLGICFGPLIAMDSPRARDKGAFNWQETLWHEIAHVVHLHMTENRIPRWLAEGMAVYEATHARSEWNMNMDLAMIRALKADDLLPIKELDKGFTSRPEMISLVYYQAAQIIEFIAERYDFTKALALLPHFKNGTSTEDAIQSVFNQSADEFDQEFRSFLHARFQPDSIKLEIKESFSPGSILSSLKELTNSEQKRKGPDAGDLKKAAENEPRNFLAALNYGRQLYSQKNYSEAEKYLKRAKELLPEYVDGGSPYSLLARIYWEQDRKPEAAAELEYLTSRNGKAFEEALLLFEWQNELGTTTKAAQALERAIAIYPYDLKLQQQLGELHIQLNQPAKALQAFQSLVGLNPSDIAGAHYLLAQAYLASGKRELARKQALLALEIAPTFEKAQEILLQAVE